MPGEIKVLARPSVKGKIVEMVSSLGRINLDGLREEIQDTGAESVWWGILSAEAKRRAAQAKFDLDVMRSRLDRQKRAEALGRGEKTTEAAITAEITLDPRLAEVHTALLDAQEAADMVESAKFSIARKQSTLESLTPLLVQEEAARRGPSMDPGSARQPVRRR